MKMDNRLVFLPLGGAEEIGMNLNLYGFEGKWLMVDLGVSFGEDRLPGIDTVMPDPKFIVERRKDLVGLVLTHGHEDHLGAIKYLWPQLRCPIYATPFTAKLLDSKLSESDFRDEVTVVEVPLGDRFLIGPFDLQYITTTHSIPEPNAIALRTKLGTVLHTGDFKIDADPRVGDNFDSSTLSKLGDEGVLAVVCDSTNVFEKKISGSESSLCESLEDIISPCNGIVAITTFASNVARIKTAVDVAIKCDRHPILVGRSLIRTVEIAREAGYLDEIPNLLSEKEVGLLPRNKVLLICTGSQGEERGALSRIAFGNNRNISLETGDVVIFSSKIIPGNEKPISRLQNRLSVTGVNVVTEKDALVHVSGHPSRVELAQMYALTRPELAIPVHGERRHIAEHVKFALELQIPEAIKVSNGLLVHLAPGPAKVLGEVDSGKLGVDGSQIVPVDSNLLKQRRKLMVNGIINITVLIDAKGDVLELPRVSSRGVCDKDDDVIWGNLKNVIMDAVLNLRTSLNNNGIDISEVVKRCARKEIKKRRGTRPEIVVEVVKVGNF